MAAESLRFTDDDCDKIRDYVNYSATLPTVLPAVEVFVGYKTAGVAGLEPADLGSLFAQVRSNADAWEPAGESIRRQTATLASISGRVVRSGEALLAAIQAMPFYARIRATVGQDLLELPILDIPEESFGPADTPQKKQLADRLESLRKLNREQVAGTEEAMRMLESFRGGIEALEPVVATRRLAVKKSNLEQIGHEVTVEPMIAALQQEYDRALQTDGPDAAITAAKRAALETAIQTLKSRMEIYRSRQRVTYTMGRLFVHFTELGMVMLDAEKSVGHLWLAWREAAAALDNTASRFGAIDGSRKLVTFLSDFQPIICNWKSVGKRATELNGIFS